ncbi:MAG: transposase [Gammaproteobacteria bacterium]|nr:transposase [Gammaproteobacteria bacterium]
MPKVISKEYNRYTNEFKRLSVLLTYHPDILATEVAEKLGIHPVMLYRWRMEMKNGDIPGKSGLNDIYTETDLFKANQKIKELESKLNETRQERDFLKKVKRFFQEENSKSSRS